MRTRVVLVIMIGLAMSLYLLNRPTTIDEPAIELSAADRRVLEHIDGMVVAASSIPRTSEVKQACETSQVAACLQLVRGDRQAALAYQPGESFWPHFEQFVSSRPSTLAEQLLDPPLNVLFPSIHYFFVDEMIDHGHVRAARWAWYLRNTREQMAGITEVGQTVLIASLMFHFLWHEALLLETTTREQMLIVDRSLFASLSNEELGVSRWIEQELRASNESGTSRYLDDLQRIQAWGELDDAAFWENPKLSLDAGPGNETSALEVHNAPDHFIEFFVSFRLYDVLLGLARARHDVYLGADPAALSELPVGGWSWQWSPEDNRLCMAPSGVHASFGTYRNPMCTQIASDAAGLNVPR